MPFRGGTRHHGPAVELRLAQRAACYSDHPLGRGRPNSHGATGSTGERGSRGIAPPRCLQTQGPTGFAVQLEYGDAGPKLSTGNCSMTGPRRHGDASGGDRRGGAVQWGYGNAVPELSTGNCSMTGDPNRHEDANGGTDGVCGAVGLRGRSTRAVHGDLHWHGGLQYEPNRSTTGDRSTSRTAVRRGIATATGTCNTRTGADAESDGQVGLAGAGRAEEHYVLLRGDEVEGAEKRDQVTGQAAGVVEVELLQAFAGGGTWLI
ncbi:hypothetical protein GCM10009743_53990 [Kribbella swartbergensis]